MTYELQVHIWSDTARGIRVEGQIKDQAAFNETFTTVADYVLSTMNIILTDIPQFLRISPTAAGCKRGQCYCRAVVRTGDDQRVQVYNLGAIYIEDQRPLIYPPATMESSIAGPGYIKNVTGTNPAANVEVSEAVPTNQRWKIKILRVILVTSSQVANRAVRFKIFDAAGTPIEFYSSSWGPSQAASSSYEYHLIPGQGYNETTVDSDNFMRIGAPPDLILPAGWKIETLTSNRQTSDNWGIPYSVVEVWFED